MKFLSLMILLTGFSHAQTKSLYLSAEDQKYYKNGIMEGNNSRERIDSTVKEINKLHGEIATLKSEMQELKRQVQELKKSP